MTTYNEQPILFTADEQAEIGEFCAKYGSDVNALNCEGMTLLHLAASSFNHIAVLKFLVSKGANVNAKDKYGYTPLCYAAHGLISPVTDFLISKGADVLPVFLDLIDAEQASATKDLLSSRGVDVNAKDENGMTALHYAAKINKKTSIAWLLVEEGADINAKDNNGLTPLDWAKINGNTAMISYLTSGKR